MCSILYGFNIWSVVLGSGYDIIRNNIKWKTPLYAFHFRENSIGNYYNEQKSLFYICKKGETLATFYLELEPDFLKCWNTMTQNKPNKLFLNKLK